MAGLTKKRMDAVLVGGDPVFMANAAKVTRAVREARALGVQVPQEMLLRADEVIPDNPPR